MIALVMALCHLSPTQGHAETEASRIRFTVLDKRQGLPSNRVLDIEQDLTGWVWLATDRGLSKFDGFRTIDYRASPGKPNSLSSNKLTCLAQTETNEKYLWIGTNDAGLNRFNPQTEEIKVYSPEFIHSDAMLGKNIQQLAVTGDQFLWIGTDKGLNVMNLMTETIRAFGGPLRGKSITCIKAVSDEEIWVGTADGGIFRWSPKDSDFKSVWQFSAPVSSINNDSRNETWIGTMGQGLYRYGSGKDARPIRAKLKAKDITSIFTDTNGDFWVGTTIGLARHERGSGLFTMFVNQPRNPDSLSGSHVNAIFEGRARMLWVTTDNGGVSRFSLDRYWFPHIRETSVEEVGGLPHSSMWGMGAGKDGTVWIGTESGLAEWIPEENFINLPFRGESFRDVYVSSVFEDSKGRLWIGTKGAGLILRLEDGTIVRYRNDPKTPPTIGHDYISAIAETAEHGILVGTWGAGVFEFNEQNRQFKFANMVENKSPRFVTQISEDDSKHIWIGSREGLFVLRFAQTTITPFRESFLEAGHLSSQSVSSVKPAENGVIWIGTEDSGLNRLRIPSGEVQVFDSFNSDLPDDSIRSLLIDRKGILWVATRSGLSRFHTSQSSIRNFTYDDGLVDGGFHQNSATVGKDGQLYFGGSDGFNIVDPDILPGDEQPPSPVLTDFEYFAEKVKPGPGKVLEKPIAATPEINIPFDKRNRIAFHFANLDFRFPGRGHFRYKLEDFEYDWNLSDDSRRAAYPSLPPGTYKFIVESSPDGKNWSENPAQVSLRISPPWWSTWWARIGLFISAILGTVLGTRVFIRSRTKSLRRREEQIRAQRDQAEAALARELQNTLLIERATRDFQAGSGNQEILNDSLKGLADQFSATQCLIHHIEESGKDSGKLRLIGSYSSPGSMKVEKFPLDPSLPFGKKILQSESAHAASNSSELPGDIRKNLDHVGAQSILTIRTSFNGQPNGLISLLQTDAEKTWKDEDFKLLNALSPQFGLAIAQIDLSNKESQYRDELQDSRKIAEVANRAKTEFLAKMTHELRTPLNAIIGFSEMIQEDKTLGDRQRQLIDIVNNSGEHLLDVINDILDVSKIEAGKAEKHDEEFELSPLLRTVYEMLKIHARTKNIGFEILAESSLPGTILTDRSKLRQTLINLIGNAIKFTEHGSVILAVKASALGGAESINGRMARPVRISFEVRDTGKGIDATEIAKLFQSYSQTETGKSSAEGTGLGLTIAKSFIELMGGEISVDSTPGKGTTFQFHIECSELAPSENQVAGNSNEVCATNAARITGYTSEIESVRILIAEDQPNNRLLLRKILEKAGFQVEEAHNGEEAVDRWRTWLPHLIFMDEDMPVMRGSEATKLIKSQVDSKTGDPIIVSLTAYAMDQARELAIESGSQDFVAKPFKSHELYRVIAKHLSLDFIFDDAA